MVFHMTQNGGFLGLDEVVRHFEAQCSLTYRLPVNVLEPVNVCSTIDENRKDPQTYPRFNSSAHDPPPVYPAS